MCTEYIGRVSPSCLVGTALLDADLRSLLSGRTQIPAGTRTVLGIGPGECVAGDDCEGDAALMHSSCCV